MSFRASCVLRSSGGRQLSSKSLRHGGKQQCVAAFYSKDVRSQIPSECPFNQSPKAITHQHLTQQQHQQRQQRYQSSMVGAISTGEVDLGLAATSTSCTHSGMLKSFEEIPVPGGHDKGIMGVVAPLYHALRGHAFTKPHEYLLSCSKELGPIFRQHTFMGWMVQLSDPDDFETVFRRVGKYPARPIIQSWVDYRHRNDMSVGLITSEGTEWQELRSAVSGGILKPSALVSHVDSMHDVVLDFIDKLKTVRRQDGVIPDIEKELYKWSMESSTTFLFDKRLNLIQEKVLKKENQDFFNAVNVLTWQTAKLMMVPVKVLNMFPQSRNPILLSDKAWDVMFALNKTYIDEKMSSLARKACRGESLDDGTFIAYLMLQNKLQPKQIYGNVSEIMAAAVDTTAYTSSFLIHELSKNPEVQDKIYAEIMRVNPEGATPTAEMLDSMTYTKAVVKETQRLFPITIATARVLDEDVTIKGYHIPKGTHISTLFYAACRDPKVFDNPYEFRPERWLDRSKKYHPFASLPFGHGPRMCVGRRLAQQEMYLLIAELVRNFKLVATKPECGSNCALTIYPEESLEPRLVDRN